MPRSHLVRLLSLWLSSACLLLAQEKMLQPSPACRIAVRIDLAELAGGAKATGLGAVWAVPEFAATGNALLARCRRVFDEIDSLLRVAQPAVPRLPWTRIDLAHVERIHVLTDPSGGPIGVVFDLDAAHADVAKTLFEAEVERCRAGATPVRIEEPWPGARRLVGESGLASGWVMVRGRQLAGGVGDPALALGLAPKVDGGAVHLDMVLEAGASDLEFSRLLGFDGAVTTCCELHVDGRGFREFLGIRGARSGALPTRQVSAAPSLPRLETPWIVARANLDPEVLVRFYAPLLASLVPEPERNVLQVVFDRFDGGLAGSISAPAKGGLVPRFALALAVRDGENLLAALRERIGAATASPFEIVARDGETTIQWSLRDGPAWLRPSMTIVDGVLLLAESPTTLRALRRARARCDELFADPDASACAVPEGSTAVGECWFDAAAIYEGLGTSVFGSQLFSLALSPNVGDPLWQVDDIVAPRDLPDPREVAPAFGRGRAIAYVGHNEAGMGVAAPALGPLLTAALSLGAGLVPRVAAMALERAVRERRVMSAELRARRLGEALRRYRQSHENALPSEVGDLVALLPPGDPEPLLAPHDPAPLPRTVLWPDGHRSEERSSFQRAPEGMKTAASVPVFAFCGAGYRGRHMLLLADGRVLWVPSETLLDSILKKDR